LIICEGPERSCQEYISRLQALRWKHFVVRGEQVVDIGEHETVESHCVLPRGFIELADNEMKVAAEMCKSAGLEDLFMTAMKVYKQ